MRKNNNIVLIGFMGSGKTTVGIRLSYRMRRVIEDTDKLIEKKEGKTISEIFAQEGEAYFRQAETALLEELGGKLHSHILSVGGGTPVREENRALLKQLGTVVYFRVKPETVYKRLQNDTTRPLLQCENPLVKIEELLAARKEAYESCADIIIDVDDLTQNEVVDKVMQLTKPKREPKPMKLLVINGPNLNFLGIRDRNIYGAQDYKYLMDLIQKKARETGCKIDCFQSNYEGAIIDRIQAAYFDGTQGIVINPGAYTHYSYAIHDALETIKVPKVEIHISNIHEREEFRKISVTAPACDKQIYGQGLDGYLQAIDFILNKS